MREAIARPQTKTGEEDWNRALDNPVFAVYSRLHPILGSLISVMEYEQIGRLRGEEDFLGPERQRMILRALNLIIEDAIKSPYGPSEREQPQYEDYQKFLKNLFAEFWNIDSDLQGGKERPNFVNSLFMIFINEVNGLKGVEGFNIKFGDIKKEIADYLPQLEQIENGRLLKQILDKLPSEQPSEVK